MLLDGQALGPLDAPDVLVVAYAEGTWNEHNSTRSDGDGGFALVVRNGARYTIRAVRDDATYVAKVVDVP